MEAVALIIAVVALFIAQRKQVQIDALRLRLDNLETGAIVSKSAADPARKETASATMSAVSVPPIEEKAQLQVNAASGESPMATLRHWGPLPDDAPDQPNAETQPRSARPAFNMEKAVGVHLPVWGGAIMLLIAGFFLARMAADNGIFTPTVGVASCAVAAIVMLGAAFGIRRLVIANHGPISAALASAAIGTLYATSFLSSGAFGLISLFNGFLLSATTAALALGIALTFGRPVLLVGLLGGYLAPFFLLAGAPSQTLIYCYLAALLLAGAAAAIRMGWWKSLAAMLVMHFAWLAGLMMLQPHAEPVLVLGVISIVATPLVVFALGRIRSDMPTQPDNVLLATALAALLLLFGCAVRDFDVVYLTGFGAFAVGSMVVSLLGRTGSILPTFVTVIAWIALLVGWRDPEPAQRLLLTCVTIAAISLPLIANLMRGRQAPLVSAVLCSVVTATFVSSMVDFDGWGGVRDVPGIWAALALIMSVIFAGASRVFGRCAAEVEADTVRSIFAAAASAYTSLAIVAVVDPSYFALAAALQVLGLSLVYRRFQVSGLVLVISVYVGVFFALLAISTVVTMPGRSFNAALAYLPHTPPWDVAWTALVLPSLAFALAATILAPLVKSKLPIVLDAAAVLLLVLAATYLILPEARDLHLEDTLVWTSLWGNLVLLIGLASLAVGHRFSRLGLLGAGGFVMASMLAIFTIFVVLPAYQFWPRWSVPGLPVLNVSITGIIIPGLFALAIASGLRGQSEKWQAVGRVAAVVCGLLVLTGVLINIRHLFHPFLLQGPSGLVERYTYSGGMLAMAFTALILGARLNSQPLRYGSLAIMLATVAKVFLFDTEGLEGIWRVVSYLAMGVALLATSWFYSRYVFGRGREQNEAENRGINA